MKTREQDIEKFRQKWEKNRKQRFLLPMLIMAGILNVFVIWGMISVNSTYDVIFIGRLVLISIASTIVVFVVGILYELMLSSDECNIKLLKEQLSKEQMQVIQEQNKCNELLTAAKDELSKVQNLVTLIDTPDATKDITNIDRNGMSSYIHRHVEVEKQKVESLQKRSKALASKKYQTEIREMAYNQIPEKTPWQYVKSMKWLKKIK
jgi:hypothetical protein